MAFLNNFDARTVDPVTSFEPIAAGKYVAVITDSQMKSTKNGDGKYLELTFEVVEGQYKGRKLWSRLNLENPSEQAVQIARGELSAICRAVGVMKPVDSAELHNLPLCIKVACKKRDDTGEITNEIKAYKNKDDAFVSSTPSQPAPAAAQIAPWQR